MWSNDGRKTEDYGGTEKLDLRENQHLIKLDEMIGHTD